MPRGRKKVSKKTTAVPAKKAGAPRKLSSVNLKNDLWTTLQDLRADKVTPATANAVARQSSEICKIVKMEVEVAKLTGASANNTLIGF